MSKKITDLPTLASAQVTDVLPIVDMTANVTKQVTTANVAAAVFASAPTEYNPHTRMNESLGNFVASGCVWTATSGLNASMTAGVVYINGFRVVVASIASQAFTASKDTYVAVDNTGAISIANSVANNATSPALPANSVWLAIPVTNGSAITSINIGQIGAVAPVVSSRVLMVSDTNGVLIYPLSSQRTVAHAQITADFTTISLAQITGLSVTFLAVANRKYVVSATSGDLSSSSSATIGKVTMWNGAVSSGTQVQMGQTTSAGANYGTPMSISYKFTATTTGAMTFNLGLQDIGGSTAKLQAGATYPAVLTAENA